MSAAAGGPAGGRTDAAALAILVACQAMLVIDTTIVTVATPVIQHGLGLPPAELTWVFNAYTIVFGGLLLLGGRAGDLLGHRRTFMAGNGLFALASLAGGLATSGGLLLAARAVQGAGAALAAPAVLALIANTFEQPRSRSRALGIWSAIIGSGMVIGLIVGGTLTAWLGWRAVFFINVPIGAALTLLAPGRLLAPVRHPGRLDLGGALTSTAGVVLLVYGFIRAATDGWANPVTAVALALAVTLLAAFAVIETRVAQPLVPPDLLARRDRVGAYLLRLLLTGAMTSELFFLTLYFQDVMRLRPLVAALAFVPTAVPVIFVSRAGRLMSRIGAKPVLVAGALITTAGVAWLSQLSAGSGYVAGVLGPIILTAVGCGFLYPAMALVALTDVPRGEAGAASGMLQAAQQIGGSLGLAALGSVFAAAAAGGGRLALATGIAAGFTGGTVIMAVVTLIAVLVIRRQPQPAPAAPAAQPAGPVQPGPVQPAEPA